MSDNRLWVHLSEGPVTKEDGWLSNARTELIQVEMPESAPFFGIGHSLGGDMSQPNPTVTIEYRLYRQSQYKKGANVRYLSRHTSELYLKAGEIIYDEDYFQVW